MFLTSIILVKEKIDSERYKECSFKPQLYPTPKHVVPTYRGQQRNRNIFIYIYF